MSTLTRSDLAFFVKAIIVNILLVVLLEGLLWLTPLPIRKTETLEGGYLSEPWGYRLAPNAKIVEDRGTHKYSVIANDDGLAYSSPSENYNNTILFIGDSFTQGTEEGMYPRNFWHLLKNNAQGEVPPRVINGGVGGYSLWEAYNWFVNFGVQYDPDLVIYGFFHNDIIGYFNYQSLRISKSRPGVRIWEPSIDDVTYWNGIFIPHPFKISEFLKRNSRLLKFIDRSLNPPQPYGQVIKNSWAIELTPALSETEKTALNQTFAHLREIKDRLDARGGKLAILFIPDGSEVVVDNVAPLYYKELMTFCAQEGLHCIDPTPALRKAYRDGVKVYWNAVDDDDAHCTPAGYSILSDTLYAAYSETKGFALPLRAAKHPVNSVSEKQHSIMLSESKIGPYKSPKFHFENGKLDVDLRNPPAGVSLKLPVEPGRSAILQLKMEVLEGAVTVRLQDGDDTTYFKGVSGSQEYALSPHQSKPELLLYSDEKAHFMVNQIILKHVDQRQITSP